MAYKAWNGFNGSWSTASNWTSSGAPNYGDTVSIGKGTVSAWGGYILGENISLSNAGPTPSPMDDTVGILSLRNTQLYSNLSVGQGYANLHGILNIIGYDHSTQTISVGSVHACAQLDIDINHNSAFFNDGTINPGGYLNINAADSSSNFVNNGTVNSALGKTTIGANTIGNGTFNLAGNFQYGQDTLEFKGTVGPSIHVNLTDAQSILELDHPMTFQGQISFTPPTGYQSPTPNWPATEELYLPNTPVTSETFSAHELTLYNGASTVAHLNVAGDYTAANFKFSAHTGGGTDITFVPPTVGHV